MRNENKKRKGGGKLTVQEVVTTRGKSKPYKKENPTGAVYGRNKNASKKKIVIASVKTVGRQYRKKSQPSKAREMDTLSN